MGLYRIIYMIIYYDISSYTMICGIIASWGPNKSAFGLPGRTVGRTDGRTDGRTVGRTDGQARRKARTPSIRLFK